ncbi:hypothetical protein AX17_005836 [Amanita inopinata Kibby_2008]|nr:hypothetical protein AX17_005836 [Amanita inopinata Kibby_2008]
MTTFVHFSCLDELAQVIYQGAYRFVVLSSVTDQEWTIHLGLADSQGRWWRGRWSEDDIGHVLGSKPSEKLLENFAERLTGALVNGELHVGNWNSEKGATINLTFDPSSKRPVRVPLQEIDPSEAAAHATNVFLEAGGFAIEGTCGSLTSNDDDGSPWFVYVALAELSHRYRLTHKVYITLNLPSAHSSLQPFFHHHAAEARSTLAAHMSDNVATGGDQSALMEGSEGARKRVKVADDGVRQSRGRAGVSLANPRKKGRKYEAIEFEED